MRKSAVLNKIAKLNAEILKLSVDLVEAEARKILKKHKSLDEFVMCMGSGFFTDANEPMEDEKFEYFRSFFKMLYDLNDSCKVCGFPMRFTADGEVIHDW